MGKVKGARLPSVIDPQKTVCVSFEIPDAEEYRHAVVGHIVLLTKWFFWQHDGSDRATNAARLFSRLLMETLNVGACCCPDQTKLLQEILQVQQQNFTLNLLNQEVFYITQWNTYWRNTDTDIYTVYNFAPVTTFISTTGEPSEIADRREDALCYAVTKLVRAIYYEAQREKEGQQATTNLVLGGLGILAGVGAIVSGGATVYLWMGLAATFGALASETLSAIELADLANAEVEAEIACALKNAMKDLAPTAASIKAAANAIRGAQPPNSAYDKMSNLIADLLAAYPDTELANTFLANLSDATNPAFTGLPACECDEPPPFTLPCIITGWRIAGETVWRDEQPDYVWLPYEIPIGVDIEVKAFDAGGRWIATIGDWATTDYTIDLVNVSTPSVVGVFDTNGSGTNSGYLAAGQQYQSAQFNLWDVEVRTIRIAGIL